MSNLLLEDIEISSNFCGEEIQQNRILDSGKLLFKIEDKRKLFLCEPNGKVYHSRIMEK